MAVSNVLLDDNLLVCVARGLDVLNSLVSVSNDGAPDYVQVLFVFNHLGSLDDDVFHLFADDLSLDTRVRCLDVDGFLGLVGDLGLGHAQVDDLLLVVADDWLGLFEDDVRLGGLDCFHLVVDKHDFGFGLLDIDVSGGCNHLEVVSTREHDLGLRRLDVLVLASFNSDMRSGGNDVDLGSGGLDGHLWHSVVFLVPNHEFLVVVHDLLHSSVRL